jgi:transcriptional regulator with XRE-family HTH domain
MTIEELDLKAKEIHDLVSANVRKYRRLKEFSQLQLALEIGMTSSTFLARAEKRAHNAHFNVEHLAKIALVLNVDLDHFFIKTDPF